MAEKTCGHEGCTCVVAEGEEFCSEYCQRHGTHEGHKAHACGCGHDGCHD